MNLSPTQEDVLDAIGLGWTPYESADQRTIDALVRRGLVEQRDAACFARRQDLLAEFCSWLVGQRIKPESLTHREQAELAAMWTASNQDKERP